MRNVILTAAVLALVACSSDDKDYDATGMFEATEVIVSAEQTGRLMYFDIDEGDRLTANQQVGLIDTVQLQLRAMQLGATKDAYASQRPDIRKQIAVTRQQLAKAEQERRRYEMLVSDNAANRKMLDDAESSVRVLRRQLEAQMSQLDNSTASLNRQMDATEIQRRQVLDNLEKCHVQFVESGPSANRLISSPNFSRNISFRVSRAACSNWCWFRNVSMDCKHSSRDCLRCSSSACNTWRSPESRASSRVSRHCICCIRKSGSMDTCVSFRTL